MGITETFGMSQREGGGGGGSQICLDNASLRAYKITAPILLGARDDR